MKLLIALSTAPRNLSLFELPLEAHTTVAQALQLLATVCVEFASTTSLDWQTAVWGKPVELTHTLKDGDRLEVLRPLRVDPKVARRERFQKQGAKTAGLFAKRRSGAKPGY